MPRKTPREKIFPPKSFSYNSKSPTIKSGKTTILEYFSHSRVKYYEINTWDSPQSTVKLANQLEPRGDYPLHSLDIYQHVENLQGFTGLKIFPDTWNYLYLWLN